MEIPKVLLGCIVQYLDITSDVFLPGFEKPWSNATHFTERVHAWMRYKLVNNTLHSLNDKPAVECIHSDTSQCSFFCSKEWYKHGKRHRENDLPALVYPGGHENWYWNGKLHRENDKPAVIINGTKEWYTNGQRHREQDLPAIERDDGTREWLCRNIHHRENGKPAVELGNGVKWVYTQGKSFRKLGWFEILCTCLSSCQISTQLIEFDYFKRGR